MRNIELAAYIAADLAPQSRRELGTRTAGFPRKAASYRTIFAVKGSNALANLHFQLDSILPLNSRKNSFLSATTLASHHMESPRMV